jgi:hypothetical protein
MKEQPSAPIALVETTSRSGAPFDNLWVPAHPGLARAAALTGDLAKSRKSYHEFFASWTDADPDLPVLLEGKREYEKLPAPK